MRKTGDRDGKNIFLATAVEVSAKDGVLTIHFGGRSDHYLRLRAPRGMTCGPTCR